MTVLPALILMLGQSGYAGSPVACVQAALTAAHVTAADTVVDIGSGDGRVCVIVAKVHGARAIGIEMDGNLAELSRRTAQRNGVAQLVEIRHADALKADLSSATVVYLYHQTKFLRSLQPQIRSLRPGTRVVCLDYPLPDIEMTRVAMMKSEGHEHTIYLRELTEADCGNPDETTPMIDAAMRYKGVRFYEGRRDDLLVSMASEYSQFMARIDSQSINRQGHIGWDGRLARIRNELGMRDGNEVTAETWRDRVPKDEYGAAVQMYESWDASPGHWSVVSASHALYGDGLALSSTGVWYGCVIVAD